MRNSPKILESFFVGVPLCFKVEICYTKFLSKTKVPLFCSIRVKGNDSPCGFQGRALRKRKEEMKWQKKFD